MDDETETPKTVVFKKKKGCSSLRVHDEVTSKAQGSKALVEAKTDEPAEDVATSVAEIKFLQKHRLRAKGLAASLNEEEEEEAEEKKTEQSSLGTAFQVEKSSENIADEVMQKWVDEELQKKITGKSKEDREREAAEERRKNRTAEDELYETPEFLKVVHTKEMAEEEEASAESGDRWLAGITEVALPIGFKLKNIEDTERAKLERFEKRRGGPEDQFYGLPSNFNANFKKHKRDWDMGMRAKDEAQRAARDMPPPSNVRSGVRIASDDKAVSRFVKRQGSRRN